MVGRLLAFWEALFSNSVPIYVSCQGIHQNVRFRVEKGSGDPLFPSGIRTPVWEEMIGPSRKKHWWTSWDFEHRLTEIYLAAQWFQDLVVGIMFGAHRFFWGDYVWSTSSIFSFRNIWPKPRSSKKHIPFMVLQYHPLHTPPMVLPHGLSFLTTKSWLPCDPLRKYVPFQSLSSILSFFCHPPANRHVWTYACRNIDITCIHVYAYLMQKQQHKPLLHPKHHFKGLENQLNPPTKLLNQKHQDPLIWLPLFVSTLLVSFSKDRNHYRTFWSLFTIFHLKYLDGFLPTRLRCKWNL